MGEQVAKGDRPAGRAQQWQSLVVESLHHLRRADRGVDVGIVPRGVKRLGRIEAAASAGDLESVRREAHDLASTSGDMGASRLEMLGRALENASRGSDVASVGLLMIEIGTAAPTAFDALVEHVPASSAA